MDIKKFLESIDKETVRFAGEVLVLTRGEFDSFSVADVVRVCRDINLRLLADAFLANQSAQMQSPSAMFSDSDFVDFLEAEGAVERIETRHVHVADDFGCAIATPRIDRAPANDPDALPYEWAEEKYDLKARG